MTASSCSLSLDNRQVQIGKIRVKSAHSYERAEKIGFSMRPDAKIAVSTNERSPTTQMD
jgi:hypothetical protein